MGFKRDMFLVDVDDNLLCGICAEVLECAVTTPCGHSFCGDCLETWLCGSLAQSSCPVCRGFVTASETTAVHALRGIVGNLAVACANAENGCKMVVRLENAKAHTETCAFRSVSCPACERCVVKKDLAEHHKSCDAILQVATLHVAEAEIANFSIEDLSKQLALLEFDLKNTKEALKDSERTVRKVEQDMMAMRRELQNETAQATRSDEFDEAWDPECNYGYSPGSIARLARFISRFMLTKPYYAERSSVFNSIKRCYDFYHRYPAYCQDVHMLLATAFASNWFTDSQRRSLDTWLNSVARKR